MTEFNIYYDHEYDSRPRRSFKEILAGASPFSNEKCYFDNNMPYEYNKFYIGITENDRVCYDCLLEKDPQSLNIIKFIINSKDLESQLKKLEIGMFQLRKTIAVSDPSAYKCPVCNAKMAYREKVSSKNGFKCLSCKIGYIGNGQFYFENKIYTLKQAKKVIGMKAFI